MDLLLNDLQSAQYLVRLVAPPTVRIVPQRWQRYSVRLRVPRFSCIFLALKLLAQVTEQNRASDLRPQFSHIPLRMVRWEGLAPPVPLLTDSLKRRGQSLLWGPARKWSDRRDSHPRSLAPEASALLGYATIRCFRLTQVIKLNERQF